MRKVMVAAIIAIALTGTAFAQNRLIIGGEGAQIGLSVRDASEGVVIDQVHAGTPAERAGFKAGDVVVQFDGENVRSARQFTRLVQETRSGRQVAAVVTRSGARQTLNVTPEDNRSTFNVGPEVLRLPQLQTLPNLRVNPNPGFNFNGERPLLQFYTSPRRLGVELTPLADQLAQYFGVKNGVLVSSVDADSPAARAGLKPGDVITQINGRRVDTASDINQEMRSSDSASSVELTITRDKKELTLKADTPATRPAQDPRTIRLRSL